MFDFTKIRKKFQKLIMRRFMKIGIVEVFKKMYEIKKLVL